MRSADILGVHPWTLLFLSLAAVPKTPPAKELVLEWIRWENPMFLEMSDPIHPTEGCLPLDTALTFLIQHLGWCLVELKGLGHLLYVFSSIIRIITFFAQHELILVWLAWNIQWICFQNYIKNASSTDTDFKGHLRTKWKFKYIYIFCLLAIYSHTPQISEARL